MLTGVGTKAVGGVTVGRMHEAGSIDWLKAPGVVAKKRFKHTNKWLAVLTKIGWVRKFFLRKVDLGG